MKRQHLQLDAKSLRSSIELLQDDLREVRFWLALERSFHVLQQRSYEQRGLPQQPALREPLLGAPLARTWLQVLDEQQHGEQRQGQLGHGALGIAPDVKPQRFSLQRNLN